jgi:hypothetical protein
MADFPEYIEKVKKTLVLVKNIVSVMKTPGVLQISSVPKTYLTPEEYLLRERTAESRSEYYRGETCAVAGALADHNLIVSNQRGVRQGCFRPNPCGE